MSGRLRLRALLAIVAMAIGLIGFARPAFATGDEDYFVNSINSIRASRGLAPLAVDGQLTAVARSWSGHMASDGTLEHNPNLSGQISNWKTAGENVGTGPNVESIESAFENSPHHFENMVDPNFNYIGVGVTQDSNGTYWVTEDFKQSSTSPRPAPAPAPPRPAAPRPQSASRPASRPVSRPAPAPVHAVAHPAAAPAPAVAAPVTAPTTVATVPPPTVPLAVLGTSTHRAPLSAGGLAVHNPFTATNLLGLVAFVVLGASTAVFAKAHTARFSRVRITRAGSVVPS